MENPKLEYEKLLLQFSEYKRITDDKISALKAENKQLGKKLAVLFNIVEISGYVNSFISKDNLMGLINDMIIGVLGASKSTIYIVDGDKFIIKATNEIHNSHSMREKCSEHMHNGQACVINIDEEDSKDSNIYSVLGIPICINSKTIGYIVAEHSLYNFFNDEHRMFLGAIANQIAIAIENASLYKELQKAAEVDPLLGMYTRRTFFNKVEKRLKKMQKNYAIVMMDFDNFKGINDTLGHQFGDEVLIQTAKVIKSCLTSDDIIARYGGEELIIYIGDAASRELVYKKVDKIRLSIANNTVTVDDKSINVTSSFGISFNCEETNTLSLNIQVADKLLYKAKYSGKNRIISSHNF